jgi:hypothetical protein
MSLGKDLIDVGDALQHMFNALEKLGWRDGESPGQFAERALKEKAELEADKRRINWLASFDRHKMSPQFDEGDPDVGLFPRWEVSRFIGTPYNPLWEPVAADSNLREAIDAAMAEEAKS